MSGFDTNFIKNAVDSLNLPVIACGGAGSLKHLKELIKDTSISAIAAGSNFRIISQFFQHLLDGF